MRVLILAAWLLPVPALADVAAPPPPCAHDDRVIAAASANGFQRLDRLPPAAEYLTVYRRVGRCPAPVIVRYDVAAARGAPRR